MDRYYRPVEPATCQDPTLSLRTGLIRRGLLRTRLDRRSAMQVGLGRRGAGTEAHAVDLQVLDDPLDVVARLGERDALDPVDRIDLGIERIAVRRNPLLDPAAARIVAGKGLDE